MRRLGHNPEDARDLTQEFFSRLLGNNSLRHADPERGRFRTFLQACLMNFLNQEGVKANELKRDGGRLHLLLGVLGAMRRFAAALGIPVILNSRHQVTNSVLVANQFFRSRKP